MGVSFDGESLENVKGKRLDISGNLLYLFLTWCSD